MMSGMMPSAVNGRSSWRKVIPHVPFCPWREANLSPIWGMRTERTLTLTILLSALLTESMTVSTMPFSPLRARREMSLVFFSVATMASGVEYCIFPTRISSLSTCLPGQTIPSSSSFKTLSGLKPASLPSGLVMVERELLRGELASSVLQVRQKAERKSPRSTADWLMMMLSSWLQPEKQAMATMGLAPMGIWLTEMYLVGMVVTRGRCGQQRWWLRVSMRMSVLVPLMPIACLLIADCSVFLVAWLWFGNGITDPHTPNIIDGCTSQCVYRQRPPRRSDGFMAISSVSSQSTSTYSTTPFVRSSARPPSPYPIAPNRSLPSRMRLSSTTRSGLMHRPASVLMRISLAWKSWTMEMESLRTARVRQCLKAVRKGGKELVKATRLPSTRILMSCDCWAWVAWRLQRMAAPSMKRRSASFSFSVRCSLTRTSMEKFLTMPIFCPSGVSEGQIIPKWVLWRRRGLADLELARMGATTLRRWERVAKQVVSRLSTWATPVRMGSPALFLPQLPVDSACRSPLLTDLWSKISWILSSAPSLPPWRRRLSILLAFSRNWLRKRSMKRLSMSAPVRSIRFLPQWSRSSQAVSPRCAAMSRCAMQPTQQAFFLSSAASVPMWGRSFSMRLLRAQTMAASSSREEFLVCSRQRPRKVRHSCWVVKATWSRELRRISQTPLNSARLSSEVESLRRLSSQTQAKASSSEAMPSARSRMPRGISLRMFLILQRMRGTAFSSLMVMRKICGSAPMALLTDRISASHGSRSLFWAKTKTWLKAMRSCPTTTFSEPFTMKQPPLSQLHSPRSMRSCGVARWRAHQSEPTMMGTSAMVMLGKFFSRMSVRVRVRGLREKRLQLRWARMVPWQVRSRRRQTAGVRRAVPSSVRVTRRWSRAQCSKRNSHWSSPATSSSTANCGGMLMVKAPCCSTTRCMSSRKRLQELIWMLEGGCSRKSASTTPQICCSSTCGSYSSFILNGLHPPPSLYSNCLKEMGIRSSNKLASCKQMIHPQIVLAASQMQIISTIPVPGGSLDVCVVLLGAAVLIALFILVFDNFQLQISMDRQGYITHLLNASKSKEAHHFARASRFPKAQKLTTEAIYALPATSSKRTTSFGFGYKLNLAGKSSSPPPGTYNASSEFERGQLMNTASFHEGRERVTFGSFLMEALKSKKDMPSPDRYTPLNPYSTIGGKMGIRVQTDPNMKRREAPGPGAYQLNSIQLGNRGHYALSTLKNSTSPRYCPNHPRRPAQKHSHPLSYDIQERQLGRHVSSSFANAPCCSFPRAARQGLADVSKASIPGAKYRSFSEFGN